MWWKKTLFCVCSDLWRSCVRSRRRRRRTSRPLSWGRKRWPACTAQRRPRVDWTRLRRRRSCAAAMRAERTGRRRPRRMVSGTSRETSPPSLTACPPPPPPWPTSTPATWITDPAPTTGTPTCPNTTLGEKTALGSNLPNNSTMKHKKCWSWVEMRNNFSIHTIIDQSWNLDNVVFYTVLTLYRDRFGLTAKHFFCIKCSYFCYCNFYAQSNVIERVWWPETMSLKI